MGSETTNTETGDIVVEAWSPRYAAAVAKLLKIEGGYVNDPVDRGGATKYGISLRFLVSEGAIDLDDDGRADFDLDGDGDIDGVDIRKLTLGDAKFLYHHCFWLPLKADDLPRPIGEMLFDQGVNAGIGNARRLLQVAINHCLARGRFASSKLNVDRVIGDKTILAMNWVLLSPSLGMPALVDAYRVAVRNRYREIAANNPSQKRFLKGWLARADELGRD